MKKIFLILSVTFCFHQFAKAQKLKTAADSVGYAIGVIMAETFKAQGITEVSPDKACKGLEDVMKSNELMMDQMVASEFLNNYMQKTKEKAGRDFLNENKKRKGVVTLPSGLQYEVIREGTGATPGPNDKVTVHYEGKLIDGTVFDSSIQRGEPASFPVSGVIKGWTEALQLMKEGAKWKLFIPHDLAYGGRQLSKIPAYSTLIFDVELLEVNNSESDSND